ncbi:hypothetical protein CK203_101631 [Vitis vinifera]|uniref:Uncharacterized protein n=1 Tax=Vitis vinifera TaxID=29760 RepID=A0A438DZG6_VITVI|nr:hypothetical protein CK203_101631 [Vitis vinifera]
MGSVGTRTYQFHPARVNRQERPTNIRDNHFPSSRPHTTIATTSRPPYSISWDWRLRCETDPSRPRQLGRPLAGISNQTNGTLAFQPRKPGADFVRIQWSDNHLPWRRCATSPSKAQSSLTEAQSINESALTKPRRFRMGAFRYDRNRSINLPPTNLTSCPHSRLVRKKLGDFTQTGKRLFGTRWTNYWNPDSLGKLSTRIGWQMWWWSPKKKGSDECVLITPISTMHAQKTTVGNQASILVYFPN